MTDREPNNGEMTTNKKAWWDKKWGKEQLCPITGGRLRPGKAKNGKRYVFELSCGHRFYRAQLVKWFEVGNTCPVCRRKVILWKNISTNSK